jgi:hypothetical protein
MPSTRDTAMTHSERPIVRSAPLKRGGTEDRLEEKVELEQRRPPIVS